MHAPTPTPALHLIAGPCVLQAEAPDVALRVADHLAQLEHNTPGLRVTFKASFDKANRTRASAYRGPGLERGLRMLDAIHRASGLDVLTDIHEPHQAAPVAEVAHTLQIPAYLCRQTDLIQAAARTGRPVNLKKGQFLAPDDVPWMVDKATQAGATALYVTERGACFGYRDLVVDPRSLARLLDLARDLPFTPVFDATHAVQQPSARPDGSSGGRRRFVPPLVRAAVAIGVRALFVETYPDPAVAPCDGPNALPLDAVGPLIRDALRIVGACDMLECSGLTLT